MFNTSAFAGVFDRNDIATSVLNQVSEKPNMILVVSDGYGLADTKYTEDRFEKSFAKFGVRIARMSDLRQRLASKCVDVCPADIQKIVMQDFIRDNSLNLFLVIKPINASNGKSCSYSTKNKIFNMPEFGLETTEQCAESVLNKFSVNITDPVTKKNILISEITAEATEGSIGSYFSDSNSVSQQSIRTAIGMFFNDKSVVRALRLQ